jgi:NAD-dependent SIR2 family protein deacetylase
MESVVAKCIGCGETREIRAGEIAPGDHPICDLCGMPMIAWKGKVVRDPPGDDWEERRIRESEK